MPEAVEYNILRTFKELSDLAPEWCALWLQDEHTTPFQHPDWLLPWTEQFAPRELRVITIRENGSLLALLPFYIHRDFESGESQLLLLGVGTSDYLDGIFAAGWKPDHIAGALRMLTREEGWDVAYASQLRPCSPLVQVLNRLPMAASGFPTQSCSRMPAVGIADLPRKIRRNVLYYRNLAARRGHLEFTIAGKHDCLAYFDALHQLHTERWRQCGQPGVLADRHVLAWHWDAIPSLARSGLLRLCALHFDGEIIAVLYSLIDPACRGERTQYFYLPAFSPRFADLRPGTLLNAFAIEHASQEGVQTIDMLRGDEEYKRMWHLERVPTCGFEFHPAQRRSSSRLEDAA